MEIENIKFKAKRLDGKGWVCGYFYEENGNTYYEGDIVMYKDNNAERRGDINWDSKAAAFCFGQDFLFHYSSEYMVVISNKFNKKK